MKDRHSQSGVSLMLAVLVLSAITAIAFSFTTIIFIELRSSGDVVRGEPALYATLGLTEEAMFQYKRYVNGPDETDPVTKIFDVESCYPSNNKTDGDVDVCQIGGVDMRSPAPELLTADDVPKLLTIYPNSSITVPMYDPYSYEIQYGEVNVTLVPRNNPNDLHITITGVDEDLNQTTPVDTTITENSDPLSFQSFLDGYQYEMKFENNSDLSFLVSIMTYEPGNNTDTPKGLPLVGQRALDIVANYLGVNRTYRVYIPVP